MHAAPIAGILHLHGQPAFLNPGLMALNAFEIDLPVDVIAPLQALITEIRPLEVAGAVAALSNGVALYNERPSKWRSDICWLSHADEPSYRWFEEIYRRLKLGAMVAPFVPHDQTVRLYAGFFVTRRRCEAIDMHYDWLTRDNHAFTLMAPITDNASEMGLTYETVRGELRDYTYRVGKGLVFGTQFHHSTAVGMLDDRAVFLCMNFGTDRMDLWDELSRTTGTQGAFFRQPDGSFICREDWLAASGKSLQY